MTDRIALILGLILMAVILLDVLANGGDVLMFLARKFATLVDYLAFWR